MKQILGLALFFLSGVAAFATPSAKAVLGANHAAVGDYPANRPVEITEFTLSGLGMTGAGQNTVDQRYGWNLGHMHMGPISVRRGYDGHVSWTLGPSGGIVRHEGEEGKRSAITEAYQGSHAWWQPDFGGAEITVSEQTDQGVAYAVLHVTPRGGEAFDAWFSEQDHLEYREVVKKGASITTTRFSDFARHDGVLIPETEIGVTSGHKSLQLTMKTTAIRFLPEKPQSFYAVPNSGGDAFALSGGKTETIVPIRFIDNHIFGPVSFNGRKPVMLMFTGAVNIITPAVAKAAGLHTEGKLPGGADGGQNIAARFAHVKELRIGNAVVKNMPVVVIDPSALSQLTGQSLNGVIGLDVFHRYVTRIDYLSGKLTFIDPQHFDPATAGTPVPFVMNGHIPQVQGKIAGVPAQLRIHADAGYALSMPMATAGKQGLLQKYKHVGGATGWGGRGARYGYMTRLPGLSLGTVSVKDIIAGIVMGRGQPGVKPFDGDVGSKLLKRFIVTFDYGHHMMYLKQQPLPVTDVSNYSRTGVAFHACQGTHICVQFVTQDSPAEAAGMQQGDVVTAVDGKAVAPKDLADLALKMRSAAAGTKMQFTITRDRVKSVITLTLKDQI